MLLKPGTMSSSTKGYLVAVKCLHTPCGICKNVNNFNNIIGITENVIKSEVCS